MNQNAARAGKKEFTDDAPVPDVATANFPGLREQSSSNNKTREKMRTLNARTGKVGEEKMLDKQLVVPPPTNKQPDWLTFSPAVILSSQRFLTMSVLMSWPGWYGFGGP